LPGTSEGAKDFIYDGSFFEKSLRRRGQEGGGKRRQEKSGKAGAASNGFRAAAFPRQIKTGTANGIFALSLSFKMWYHDRKAVMILLF